MDEAKKEKRAEKRRAANESLRLELETLRESLTDILDRFKIRVDAELIQLIEASHAGSLPSSSAETMLKELRSLKIKPNKARAKDLERIEEVTEELMKSLPAKDHGSEPLSA